MADTPLQMLEIARAQSAQAFGSIERSIQLGLETQRLASQAEVNLKFQGLQFAEEMRRNDAAITQMNNQNEIAAKRFELESQLAPLKLETERLQLETQKQVALNAKRQTDLNFMSTITAPWDKSVASVFAQNQNPSYMRAYLDHKSQWLGKVSSGQTFDSAAYQKGIDQINQQFKDSKPPQDGAWNQEVSMLLGMADRETQEQYNMRNPEVMASKNMLIGSFLETKDTSKFWSDYGRMFKGDEVLVGKMDIARTAYQSNQNAMEGLIAQMQRLPTIIAASEEGSPEQASARKEYSSLYNQYTELQKRNQNIKLSFATGNLDTFDKPQPAPVAPPIVELNKLPQENTTPTMGVLGGGESSMLKTRLERVSNLFASEESRKTDPANPLSSTELRNLNFSWFESNLKPEEPDTTTKKSIRNKVMDGIEATGIKGRANEQRINSLLSTMDKEINVPISPWLAKQLFDNLDQVTLGGVVKQDINLSNIFADSYSYNPDNEYFINVGGSLDYTSDKFAAKARAGMTGAGIASYKAFEDLITKIPNKAAREEARKELFSVITTAAISSALSKR